MYWIGALVPLTIKLLRLPWQALPTVRCFSNIAVAARDLVDPLHGLVAVQRPEVLGQALAVLTLTGLLLA
jgi:hypothetical protein